MKPLPSVLVIIINYHTSELMRSLIDSVQEDSVTVRILIVDNASTDKTYAPLAAITDSHVEVLRSTKNAGFTGGINLALKHVQAKSETYSHFFLLNPDAVCSPNLIGNLYRLLVARTDAACISPKIYNTNGSLWYNGAVIDYSKGRVFNTIDHRDADQKEVISIDVFSGCAVLFDMPKVLQTGLFNESLFMYYDEADFSLRLRKKGYQILFAPQLQLLHDVSYTTRKISFLKTYYMTRNKFFVFNNTMSFFEKTYFLLHEFAFHLKYRRFKNAWYHLKGYLHYRQGRLGQL